VDQEDRIPDPRGTGGGTSADTGGATDEDRGWMRRIATGDTEAFTRLFDVHSPCALGLLVKMLGSRGEAEEVLQEVFLEVWHRAESYDPGRASVRGWILLLSRCRALDRIRSRHARLRREREVHERETRLHGAAEGPVGTRRLEEEERSREVFGALGELPEEQRRAVELAFFEGLSHSQIARHLKAPLGTVKSRVLLGMNKLRRALQARGLTAGAGTSR